MPERSTSTGTPFSPGSPDPAPGTLSSHPDRHHVDGSERSVRNGRLVVGAGGSVGFLDAAGLDAPRLEAAMAQAIDRLAPGALLTVSALWSAEREVVAVAARHGAVVVAAVRHSGMLDATFALALGPPSGARRVPTTE